MNKKVRNKKIIPNNKQEQSHKIDYFLMALFAISISILIFFRGGYFEKEMLRGLIFIYIIFGIFIFTKVRTGEVKIFESPIDILLLGMVIIYALSITYGVNKRASLIEFSKHIGFFSVYIMGRYLSRLSLPLFKSASAEEGVGMLHIINLNTAIINVILLTGVGVSIIGIGAGIKTWELVGAVLVGNRISSTLQYPNTLAVYVSALYTLSLMMISKFENRISKGVYGSFLGAFIFTLIATYSRAMWLMFPLVVIFYFIVIPNTRKLETVIYIIASAVVAVPMAFLYMGSISEPSPKLWGYYIVASIGSGLLVYLSSMLSNRFRQMPVKRVIISLTALTLTVFVLALFAVNQTEEITLKNDTSEERTSDIVRNVTEIYPNTNYDLKLKYDGKTESEEAPIGVVVINYLDEKGSSNRITSENIIEVSGEKIINFTTLDDVDLLTVYFQNTTPKTSITIYSAELIETETRNVVSSIPLKYKYVPEDIVRRINSISSSDSSATARLNFNKDGLKIVKDYPILGAGGGGWVSLYQKYQSYPYWTTLAHNYFLQLWIEIGTVGFLMLLGFLIILSISAYRTYGKAEEISHKLYIAGVCSALFTILMHAFVDFDMSLMGYALVFWALIGILAGSVDTEGFVKDRFKGKQKILNSKPVYYLVTFVLLALIFNNYNILSTGKYLNRGAEASDNNDIDGLIENYEKAARRDSLRATIKIDLANAYKERYRIFEDIDDIDSAYDLTEEYLKLAPTDGKTQSYGSEFYFILGEVDKGIELADKVVELNPMRSESYLLRLDAYSLVAKHFYEIGDIDRAKEFLQEGLSIKDQMVAVNEKAFRPIEKNDDLVKKIGQVTFMLKNIYRLDDIEYENGEMIFAYYFDVDVNDDGLLDMLHTLKPEGSLIEHKQLMDGNENYIRISNKGEVYGFKYISPISLEPDISYMVELKARGNIKPGTFRLYTWSSGASGPNQGELLGIELTDDWQTYSFEFTTDSDIEVGRQYIGIQHNGNDEGYVDIMDLAIFKK